MVTVAALIAAGSLCMECLVRQTALRVETVDHQIETLGAHVREGRCSGCAEDGPVFSLPR
jgi:hypothetical protein